MNLKEMSNEELLRYDYNETDYPDIFKELLSRLEQGENLPLASCHSIILVLVAIFFAVLISFVVLVILGFEVTINWEK